MKEKITERFFCTYFDKNFIPRGMALYSSLSAHLDNFTYYVLALDEETVAYFEEKNDNNIHVYRLQEYIAYFNIDVNKFASKKELYFSLTPGWCTFIIEKNVQIDILTYLDADIFFFQSPEFLYHDLGEKSIAMAKEYDPQLYRLIYRHSGHFNVGINMFRNNNAGLKCLSDWRKLCHEWSPESPNSSLPYFSDQIYLDDWPKLYGNDVKIFDNIGINVAPAHLQKWRITKKGDTFYVQNKPIVAYHFMQLSQTASDRWHTNAAANLFNLTKPLEELYTIYIKKLKSYQEGETTMVKLNQGKVMYRELGKKILRFFLKENIIVK
jgi:hypothetical protein